MKIEEIFIDENPFGKMIEEWASGFNISKLHIQPIRTNFDSSQVDSLVVFHENHDLSKHYAELIESFEIRQKNVCKIDLKGTLAAGKSNFELWLERNHPTQLLIVGESELSKNINTPKFLESVKLI